MKKEQGLELRQSESSTEEEFDKEEKGFLVVEESNDTGFTAASAAHILPRKAVFFFLCGFCSNFILVLISWLLFRNTKGYWNCENEEMNHPLSSSSPSSSSSSSTASDPIQVPLFLNNSAAYKWLLEEASGEQDYFLLQQGFEAQVNQAYCGVASATTLLNSFRNHDDVALPVDYEYDPYPYATQDDVLDNACVTQNVIFRDQDFDGILAAPFGLGMAQVSALLKCFFTVKDHWQIQATPLNPSKMTLEEMRDKLMKILQSDNARVLVNFDRHIVHEEGGGHWSPVAKYSATIDAFLILDVAKYKYPATWVPAQLLYQAMGTTDECGIWDFPTAQQDLAEELLYPESSLHYKQAMKQLDCQPTWRGFVSVQWR